MFSLWCRRSPCVYKNLSDGFARGIQPMRLHNIFTSGSINTSRGKGALASYASTFTRSICSTPVAAAQSKPVEGRPKGGRRMLYVALGGGIMFGMGYLYMKRRVQYTSSDASKSLFTEKPAIDFIAKRVVNPNDSSKLHITLFQYEPCPFCKKVRAFLDFSGLSYDVVEVNPITKKQIGWSTYKKVPLVVVQVKDGYQQLNDSSAIISTLASYLLDPSKDLAKIVQYYPEVNYDGEKGEKKSEILNRYFLMYGDKEPLGDDKKILAERTWRKWSDDILMHTISPNIYRTWDEALEAFHMFSEAGSWQRIFSPLERQVIIYMGAAVMLLVGKRLKKRHHLLEDARQSLYNEVNYFLEAIKGQGTTFIGGEEPNLADLSVYACISSIHGTRAFNDLMQNTSLTPWYDAMCSAIDSRRGKILLP